MKQLIFIISLSLLGIAATIQCDKTNVDACFEQFMQCMNFCAADDEPSSRGICYQVCGQVYFDCKHDGGDVKQEISMLSARTSVENQEFIKVVADKILSYEGIKTKIFNLGYKVELTTPSLGDESILGIIEAYDDNQNLKFKIYDSENNIVYSDEVSISSGKHAFRIKYSDLALNNYIFEFINPNNNAKGTMNITIK